MNTLMLAGRLGADPETKYTSGGQKVTTLRLAVNSRRKGQDETMWWRVTIWGEQFDRMMPHLKKGSAIIVHGEMQKPAVYNNREGQPQASLDITAHQISFSPFGKSSQEEASHAQPAMAQAAAPAFNQAAPPAAAPAFTPAAPPPPAFSDDEIPF